MDWGVFVPFGILSAPDPGIGPVGIHVCPILARTLPVHGVGELLYCKIFNVDYTSSKEF
jgi:hypothetical protein